MRSSALTRTWQLGLMARDAAAADKSALAARMGSLHGLPQKLGQVLALSDLCSDSSPYAALTDGKSACRPEEVLRAVEESLGNLAAAAIERIEDYALSASLGSVHPVELKDGRKAALKIRHPGICESVSLELSALGLLSAPAKLMSMGFDLGSYRSEIGDMLSSELDYRQEAKWVSRFSELSKGCQGLETPSLVPRLCGDEIITTTWVDGVPLGEIGCWTVAQRRQAGETLVRLFLMSTFDWGVIHCDPHPGNYRFSLKNGVPVVGLVDFGCVKELKAGFKAGLGELFERSIEGQLTSEEAGALFIRMGFSEDLMEPVIPVLAALSRALVAPLRHDGPFDMTSWDLAQEADRLLGSKRWNLRFAGPAEMIYWVRSYVGVIQYLKALDTPVDWGAIWREVAPKQAAVPEDRVPVRRETLPGAARWLRIRVSEGSREKVSLSFPARCAEDLEEMMDDALLVRLKEKRIDLKKISGRAAATGLVPQELFRIDDELKSVRVWLGGENDG